MKSKIKNIEITTPVIVETFIDKEGTPTPVNIIDYGASHLLVDKKDLGSIDDIMCSLNELYYFKREYRYLLKLCFGEIKNSKKRLLKKKYKKDLELLNSWFAREQQNQYKKRLENEEEFYESRDNRFNSC